MFNASHAGKDRPVQCIEPTWQRHHMRCCKSYLKNSKPLSSKFHQIILERLGINYSRHMTGCNARKCRDKVFIYIKVQIHLNYTYICPYTSSIFYTPGILVEGREEETNHNIASAGSRKPYRFADFVASA